MKVNIMNIGCNSILPYKGAPFTAVWRTTEAAGLFTATRSPRHWQQPSAGAPGATTTGHAWRPACCSPRSSRMPASAGDGDPGVREVFTTADWQSIRAILEAGSPPQLAGVDPGRYQSTHEPLVQQAYLKASNTGPGDQFGHAIAVSGDTVVVGAPFEAGAGGLRSSAVRQ
ncbi:MAG: FG-GAP repeat protein [Gammaproteobacteria bacterium]|nr:FG-GAP repeat protein [Gammaproteobacteria bacterium]